MGLWAVICRQSAWCAKRFASGPLLPSSRAHLAAEYFLRVALIVHQGMADPDGRSIGLLQIFKAVPYCVDLVGGPYIETNDAVVKAFRPPAEIRRERPQ